MLINHCSRLFIGSRLMRFGIGVYHYDIRVYLVVKGQIYVKGQWVKNAFPVASAHFLRSQL